MLLVMGLKVLWWVVLEQISSIRFKIDFLIFPSQNLMPVHKSLLKKCNST